MSPSGSANKQSRSSAQEKLSDLRGQQARRERRQRLTIWTAAITVARDGGFRSFAATLAKKHLTKVPLEALAQREWLKMVLAEGGS